MNEIAFRYTTVLIAMGLDIASGVIKMFIHNKPFSSAKMAVGLFKKAGVLCIVFLSDLLRIVAIRYLNTDIDISQYVYLYTILMESLSICENLAKDDIIQVIKRMFIKGE